MKKFIITSSTAALAIFRPVSASEILSIVHQAKNPEELIEKILCPNGTFDISKARHFFSQLKDDIKTQHGIEIDLNLAITETIKIMTETRQFSETEIAIAQDFYSQLFESSEETKKIRFFSKKKKPKQKELVLPDKMASGFVLMLGGALLCILPFGVTQALGTGMVTTGLYSVIDAAREGERAYYVDSETGTPLDQNSEPSVGVGLGF